MTSSLSSFFDFSSPFVEYCTQTTLSIFLKYIQKCAIVCQVAPAEAVRELLNVPIDSFESMFKQEIIHHVQQCYDEYLTILASKSTTKLTNNNFQEIIKSSNTTKNGYRHLNCTFNGIFNYCIVQAKYIFQYLLDDHFSMNRAYNSYDENFSIVVVNVLRGYLKSILQDGNEKIIDQIRSDGISLGCKTDNSCESQHLNEIITHVAGITI